MEKDSRRWSLSFWTCGRTQAFLCPVSFLTSFPSHPCSGGPPAPSLCPSRLEMEAWLQPCPRGFCCPVCAPDPGQRAERVGSRQGALSLGGVQHRQPAGCSSGLVQLHRGPPAPLVAPPARRCFAPLCTYLWFYQPRGSSDRPSPTPPCLEVASILPWSRNQP